MDNDLLAYGEGGDGDTRDSRFNIFRFQDHLNEIFQQCLLCSVNKKYDYWFELLRGLYTRIRPFLEEKEKFDIDRVFQLALKEYGLYNNYQNNFKSNNTTQIKNFAPPTGFPASLHELELWLFEYAQRHSLLMQMVNKTSMGGGSR